MAAGVAIANQATQAAAAATTINTGKEVGKQVVLQATAGQIMKELVVQAGIQIATAVAVDQVTHWAGEQVEKHMLDGVDQRIENGIEGASYQRLKSYPILLIAESAPERSELLKEVQDALYRAVKEQKHQKIIHELGGGVAHAVAKHGVGVGASIAKIAELGHKGVRIIDGIAKIDPLINELKVEICNIIDQKAEKAKGRLARQVRSAGLMQNDGVAHEMAHNMGEMSKHYIMNLIQGRIVQPVLRPMAEMVVDKAVKEISVLKDKIIEENQEIKERREAAKAYAAEIKEQAEKEKAEAKAQAQANAMGKKTAGRRGTGAGGGSAGQGEIAKKIERAVKEYREARQDIPTQMLELVETSQLPVFVFEDGRLTETYGMHLKGKPVIVELKEGNVSIKASKAGGGTINKSRDGVTSNYADNNHLNLDNIYLASNHSANNTSERGEYINPNHPLVVAANDNTNSRLLRGRNTVDPITTMLSANIAGTRETTVGAALALGGGPKTLGDIGNNLVRDFIAPSNIGKAQFANPSMMALSAAGEVGEYIQENLVYGINKLPGGEYVLSAIGSVVGPIINTTHNILAGAGSLVLSDAQVEYLKQKYTELPHGMQVLGRDILDIATLSAAGKVAGSTLKVMATEQELVRNTKYIKVTPDMLYKHPEPLKPHPKQAYVPPIVLTDVEYIDLTKPVLHRA